MTKRKYLKESYIFKCAKCGKEHWSKPSMAMECGYNSGHATCKKCKEFLRLEIYPDIQGEIMKSKIQKE
jgi:transcription elongation factor Elf1